MSYEIAHTFQVDKIGGDKDFVTVYDLPASVAKKFVEKRYPAEAAAGRIFHIETENKTHDLFDLMIDVYYNGI